MPGTSFLSATRPAAPDCRPQLPAHHQSPSTRRHRLSTTATPDPKLGLRRRAVATPAYRGGKPLRGCPEGFADFRAAPATRTPVEVLAHLGDLLEWAASQVRGESTWRPSPPQAWEQEKA